MRLLGCIVFSLFLISCKKDFSDLNVIVTSHAGESIYFKQNQYPPNSIEGINEVILNSRADAVEVDVQMTKDHKLVLWHDQYLDENSKLSGCIADFNETELLSSDIYGTNFKFAALENAIELTNNVGLELILDVKHYNFCSETKIDYELFNAALNELLIDLSSEEKQKIIVNCRDLALLNALSDSEIRRSIESDDLEFSRAVLDNPEINMVFIKLDVFNDDWKNMLAENQSKFGLYNLNNRTNVNKALNFAPDYVITDKLDFTLNSVYGKE